MKNIYYFLDYWITQEDYTFLIDKISLLDKWYYFFDLIDKFYYKIWEDNSWRINKTFFIEFITFLEYCKNEFNLDYKDINIVYKNNFIFINTDLFIFDLDWYKRIDIKNSYFVNIRYPWFNHIFRIFKKLWWKTIWINHRWDWPYNDKIFMIYKIYSKNNIKKYLWNIIIPFINSHDDKILDFLYYNILNVFNDKRIVIKKTFWEMWSWVRALDLNIISKEEFFSIIKKFININSTTDSFYIVPFYDIISENRIYYLYDKEKNFLDIKSVKVKNTNFSNVFELESFELYKWIEVNWSYINPEIIINNYFYHNYIKKIVKLLWFETWVIEIWVLNEKEFRFFELNPYWWSLMFREEQSNMYDFYLNIYKNRLWKEK